MERGSTLAVAEIAKHAKGIRLKDMELIHEMARAAGGTLVSLSRDDDDWCGNGRIILKWPPKRRQLFEFLDSMVQLRVDFEVLINGTPVPEEVMINFENGPVRYW